MLHEFLNSNHDELVARCREKAAKRFEPAEIPTTADLGVPLFVRHLVDILRREEVTLTRADSDPKALPTTSEFGRTAASHGSEMLRCGFSIGQVVHSYGDVCQSVTELAVEQKVLISADEFRTLNRCLDDAIAGAVTSFSHDHQVMINDGVKTLQERLDHFSDEQRRLIDIAIHSYSAIRTGTIGLTGATGTLLTYILSELRAHADRALPVIRQAHASAAIAPE